MDRAEAARQASAAWKALGAGDIEGAVRLVGRWVDPEDGEPAVPDPDICLAQAHIALAEGAYPAAVSSALAALSTMGGCGIPADEAAALTASFQRVICEAGKGMAGLAGKRLASFETPDAAKRASGAFSGLSTRLYLAKPVPVDAKAGLVKHFALCAVTCDNALMEMCRKKESFFGRLHRSRGGDVAPIAQPLPSFDVAGPGREDAWDAMIAG